MSVQVNRKPVVDPPITSVVAESDAFPGRRLNAAARPDGTFELGAFGFNQVAVMVLSRDDLIALGNAYIALAG